jgi:predicted sugar kinase
MSRLALFDPGNNLILHLPPKKILPKYKSLSMKFPGRIHITPIDCNRFDFGKPGGGGMGFAVELDNELHIKICQKDEIISDDIHKPLLNQYVALLRKLFVFDGGLEVKCQISSLMRQHSGLGSSVALAIACTQGINELFGAPLSGEDIRQLVADNFVEVSAGKLSRGLETGVGTYVILNGGFAIIADSVVPLYSTNVLNGLPVILVSPTIQRSETDKPESLDMLERSLLLDASYRYTRAYRIVMDIVPSLARRDLRAAGDVVWDFQFSGTHQSMIQAYHDGGIEIIQIMTLLRKAGGLIVGMSSVGPTLYAVCEDSQDVVSAVSSANLRSHLTCVSRKGIQIFGRK